MLTKGINSQKDFDKIIKQYNGALNVPDKIYSEIRLKSMITSCFCYGNVNKDSWYYERYILPYSQDMPKRIFTQVYKEQVKYLQEKCEIVRGVYTDSEGNNYNSVIER